MLKGRHVSVPSKTRAGLVAILLGALGLASMTLTGAKALVSETPEKVLPADGYVYAVSFNPADGRLAVLSNFGNAITVFSPNDWELQHKIDRNGGIYPGNALVFARDGNIITSTTMGDYSHDPRYANTADPRYPRVDIFTLVKYASANGRIMGYFPNPGPFENTLPTGVNAARTFASSKDGSLLAAVAGPPVGAYVRVFDEHSGLLIQTIDIPQPASGLKDNPRSVAYSPSGLLGVGTTNGRVHLFDPRSGARQGSIEAYSGDEYSISALAFSPDGKFLVTGKYRNFGGRRVGGVMVERKHSLVGADIWTPTGAHVAQLIGPPELAGGDDAPMIYSLSWNPNGSTLAVGNSRGLDLWKMSNGKPELILTRPIKGGISSVAHAADGTLATAAIGSVLIFK